MEAIVLTPLHYIYLIGVIVVLATMIGRKDTVLPCIIFTFIMGYVAHGDIIRGLQACYNAWLFSGIEFFGIIATIAAIVAMSKSMADMGADYLMMNPIAKMMKTPDAAFFILGIAMMIITWFIWPSPAVALIGGIMTPIAVRIGLPPIGSAITMNIFGHGVAFSMDFIIQGAPGVTGAAAGIEPGLIVEKALPIFVTVSVVAVILSYVFL
ncbi:MAG: citrate transporter, partial [Oscillospiraceae bacterium]|nr:citrate transporter [Oscillospiraceae bacterium]